MTITAEQAQALKAGITPGPWDLDEGGQILSKTRWWDNGVEHVDFRYANVIGRITDNWDQIPNARAIAAVPDLLDTIISQAAEIKRLTHLLDLSKKTTEVVLEHAQKAEDAAALARRDAQMKAEGMREAAEVVRTLIPIIPPNGPDSTELTVEYSALGFSMQAILSRADEIEREAK